MTIYNRIATFTGKLIDPLNINIEDISIEDIAHSLAHQCRFMGHSMSFYSIAQHCYHVSTLVDQRFALSALLHDASEAYLCDLPRPIKALLPVYKQAEELLEKRISEKFNIPYPLPQEVKRVDSAILIAERNSLMVLTSDVLSGDWDVVDGAPDLSTFSIHPISSKLAERLFITRFNELYR